MSYKIKQLAKLAGVSVRTLHYYDELDLLKPSGIMENGYRFYEKPELLRLQQILFYRELDFALDDIKQILDKSDFNIKTALAEHKRLLTLKKNRLDQLILTINKTMKHMNTQENIKDEELYDPFRDDDVKQYQSEVKLRWGDSEAYRQSMHKVRKMTKAQMDKMKADGKIFTQTLADSMDKDVASDEVQDLIAEHYKGIQFFYDCPLDIYRNLGKMYVNDPRFTAYYDKFRPGLAVFVRDAINIYCDKHQKEANRTFCQKS